MVSFRNRPDFDVNRTVKRTGQARIPTPHGVFTGYGFSDELGREHIAYVGEGSQRSDPLVRVHSECLTGDVFRSLRCDCGSQLDRAMELIGGPDKREGLSTHGIEVIDLVPLAGVTTPENARYLETKRRCMYHSLDPTLDA